MISRIRKALIPLAFTPWVSAAPVLQHSDLPLVKSFPATCNFDLNQPEIQHDLCTLVHGISEIVDEAILTSPVYIVDVGEHSEMQCTTGACIYRAKDQDSPLAVGQTSSDTAIAERRPGHDFTLFAGQYTVIKYDTRPSNVRGRPAINLEFLAEMHVKEPNSMHVNDGCAQRLTQQLLSACAKNPVESLKITASNELLQEEEVISMGKTGSKRDQSVEKNMKIFASGERDVGVMKREKRNTDASLVDEDNDGSPGDVDPVGEEENERNLIPPTEHNPWSLTTIILLTSFMLIIAGRLFYARWRGLLKSYRKPLRFRVGETALLRWASEDMVFDDEEPNTIVNGNDLTTDEEIPLNPSPTKGFVIQYGSAQ